MRRLRSFLNDRRGVAALEFALIAPILLVLLMISVTAFVMVREDQTAKSSTFTAGDMIARQSRVNDAYLDFVYALFLNVAQRDRQDAGIRITSVTRSGNKFNVDWSYAKKPLSTMTSAMVPHGRLPDFADGESVVITESLMNYTPLSQLLHWESGQRYNITVSRPRFAKSVARD